ncbi:hypothetical protein GUA87_06505 [Sneathiella sp. P13V-1]|uniref:hypothetical protein n=1 Tax=Sneathiella sp. P13V-1 TaxID=2697366 RepID=UPI00187B6CC0|nr:hypothetical protein [Sneathiella sp. P13V-1]MBE7636491.1 hypothetical protein [Sneathiella sp. P13V-1]
MMRNLHRAFFIVLLFVAAIQAPAMAMEMLELRIEGAEGQAFSGDCVFQQKLGPAKRQRISGSSPTRILFPAKTLQCNIQKSKIDGFFKVTISRGNTVEIIQNSRYPFKWILVQSTGAWGDARGSTHAARPTFR